MNSATDKPAPVEPIPLWTTSPRAEMPEGTIVSCDLLGVSAAT